MMMDESGGGQEETIHISALSKGGSPSRRHKYCTTLIISSIPKNRSTGYPNKFGIYSEMFASEASIVYEKNCILLQKIVLSALFVNCKK